MAQYQPCYNDSNSNDTVIMVSIVILGITKCYVVHSSAMELYLLVGHMVYLQTPAAFMAMRSVPGRTRIQLLDSSSSII
jgi:uncharacterized membrane protein YobD (UPF0266 family)